MNGPSLWRLLMLVIVVGLFTLFTGRYGLHPFLVFVSLTIVFGAAVPTAGYFEATNEGVKLWFQEVGPSVLLCVITGALTTLTRRLYSVFGNRHGILVASVFSLLGFVVDPTAMLLLFGPLTINYSIMCNENPSGPLLAIALGVISVSSTVAPSLGPMKAINIFEAPIWASLALGLPIAGVQMCLAWLWAYFIASKFPIRLPADEIGQAQALGGSRNEDSAIELDNLGDSKKTNTREESSSESEDGNGKDKEGSHFENVIVETYPGSSLVNRKPTQANIDEFREKTSEKHKPNNLLEIPSRRGRDSGDRSSRSTSSSCGKIHKIRSIHIPEKEKHEKAKKHVRSYSYGSAEIRTSPFIQEEKEKMNSAPVSPERNHKNSHTVAQTAIHKKKLRKLNTSDPGYSSFSAPTTTSTSLTSPKSPTPNTTPKEFPQPTETNTRTVPESVEYPIRKKISCSPGSEPNSESESYDLELGSSETKPSLYLSPAHNAWFMASAAETRSSPPSFWLAFATLAVPTIMMISGSIFRGLGASLLSSQILMYMEGLGNALIVLPISVLISFSLPEVKTRRMASVDGEVGLALRMACTLAFNSVSSSILASVARNTMNFKELVEVLPRDAGVFAPFVVAFVEKFFMGYSIPLSMSHSAETLSNTLPKWDLNSDTEKALAAIAIGAGTLTASHVTDSFFWTMSELTRYDMFRMMLVYKLGTFIIGIVTCLLAWLMVASLWAGLVVTVGIILFTLTFIICMNCICQSMICRINSPQYNPAGK